MKQLAILFVACLVIAYHLQSTEAQFSFSLPGKWGNGKRGFSFSLPGRWGSGGKRSGLPPWANSDCGRLDPEALLNVYAAIQEEAMKMSDCLNKGEQGKSEES